MTPEQERQKKTKQFTSIFDDYRLAMADVYSFLDQRNTRMQGFLRVPTGLPSIRNQATRELVAIAVWEALRNIAGRRVQP